jgi:hypothetical protein
MDGGGYDPFDPLDDSMWDDDELELEQEETGIDHHVSPEQLGDDTPTPTGHGGRGDDDSEREAGRARIRPMPRKMGRRFPTAATILITRMNGAQILFVREG